MDKIISPPKYTIGEIVICRCNNRDDDSGTIQLALLAKITEAEYIEYIEENEQNQTGEWVYTVEYGTEEKYYECESEKMFQKL